jgi:hypothetical protein
MSVAAAHVVRRLEVTGARASAALLVPRLAGGLAHLPAPLGLVRALALPRPAHRRRRATKGAEGGTGCGVGVGYGFGAGLMLKPGVAERWGTVASEVAANSPLRRQPPLREYYSAPLAACGYASTEMQLCRGEVPTASSFPSFATPPRWRTGGAG